MRARTRSARSIAPTLPALPNQRGEFAHGHPRATGGTLEPAEFARLVTALGLGRAGPERPPPARGPAVSGRLSLAGFLGRVDRHPHARVERGPDDPVLLERVGGRVALARARALGPADVAELEVAREDVQQARRHVRAGAHVPRLLLDPQDLAQVRVARDLLQDLGLGEGVEQLDAGDRDVLLALARGVALEVVVDLARAEDQA